MATQSNDSEHRFGGDHTVLKLQILQQYQQFYTTALRWQPFTLWYIDAFAGTGSRTVKVTTGGLFEGSALAEEDVTSDGSASLALKITPPFDRFIFMEKMRKRRRALQELKAAHPDRNIIIDDGNDCNVALQRLFANPPWVGPERGSQRGLVFLDPYGINVQWATLKALSTCKVDVWYLVNLAGIRRQMPHRADALDPSKEAALLEVFGTSHWRDEFYSAAPAAQQSLFDAMPADSPHYRDPELARLSDYLQSRWATLFCFVSEPVDLANVNQADYFQLYCFSNNESLAAQTLIRKGVKAITKRWVAGARRTSCP